MGLVIAGGNIYEEKEKYNDVFFMWVDYLREEGKGEEAKALETANVHYYLDLNTFFEYYSLFNKTQLAKYLGINSSLLRRLSLEPIELSEKKALQIQTGLHKLADELKQYHFA